LHCKRTYTYITELLWNDRLSRGKKFTVNIPLNYMALNVSVFQVYLQGQKKRGICHATAAATVATAATTTTTT
jgi:hypothetical protein